MTTKAKAPKVHLAVTVSLADYEFIPGDEGHCPIANALQASDPDIMYPRVTDKRITFSRRSTDRRYTYQTPIDAVRYIHAVDAISQTNEIPGDLKLVLTDTDLLSTQPRSRAGIDHSLRKAAARKGAVRVVNGEVTVEPGRAAAKHGDRPNRVNTAAARDDSSK